MNWHNLLQSILIIAISGLGTWVYTINQTVTRLEYTTSSDTETEEIRLRLVSIEHSIKHLTSLIENPDSQEE